MQRRGDQDEAVDKQPRGDEDKESPGLELPGHKKKERPKRNDHKRRRKETRHPPDWSIRGGTSSRGSHPHDWINCGQVAAKRPGLDRPGWVKQQEPPPPGQEHPGTSGGGRPPDWNIRGGTSCRRHGEPQKSPRERGRADAAKQRAGRGRGEAEKTRSGQGQGDAVMHTGGRGRGVEVERPRGRGRGETTEQR